MPNVYVTDTGSNRIYTALGYLKDSGSTFPVPNLEPDKVIKFTTGNPAGIELTQNTTTPTTPNSGEWGYSGGYVYLGDALQSGETVFALKGDINIFEGVTTLAGTSYFDVGQSDENYRTKQQQLELRWLGAGEELRSAKIELEDSLASEGSEATHYQLAADNSGSPGEWKSSLQSTEIPDLEALKDGRKISFWVKCVKPEGSDTGIFSDVQVKITGTRYKYAMNDYLTSNSSTSIELPFDHYFLIPYVIYEIVSGSPSQFKIPAIYWDGSTPYLRVGWNSGSGSVRVRYIVVPVDHSDTYADEFTSVSSYAMTATQRTYGVVFTTNNRYCTCIDYNNNLVFSGSASGYIIKVPSIESMADVSENIIVKTWGTGQSNISLGAGNYMLFALYTEPVGGRKPDNMYFPYVVGWGAMPSVHCPNVNWGGAAVLRGVIGE